MPAVIAHGYIGVTSPDVDAWSTYATSVLGMSAAEGCEPDQLLLRMDERGWRICVEPGEGGLAYSGWEVAGEQELHELAAKLEANGVAIKQDDELAAKRGVVGLFRCLDPGGNAVELFCGAHVPKQPFVSPTGARFVTANERHGELGFGHSVVMFPDAAKTKQFYLELLGFRISDTLTVGPATGYFTHVNARHHSFAFVPAPQRPSAINHIMVEVDSIDTLGRALDHVLGGAADLTLTLGKHTNDHMISFYTKTPSGFMIEYGFDGRLINEQTWTTASYDAVSFWGHLGAPT